MHAARWPWILVVLSCSSTDPTAPPPPPPPPPGSVNLALQTIATGLDRPVDLTAAPGDLSRLFVAQQTGAIRVILNGSLLPAPFLDLSGQVTCCGEQGLLGIAFHPNYGTNGRFFVHYSQNNGDTRISSFTVSADPNQADPASESILLNQSQFAGNHNGGQIVFGPDGYFYISLGDGGGGGDPQANGQDRTTLLGSILRIDVDGGSPYAIPGTNPYRNHLTFREELWNYGLRNAWRFSFDRSTGDMYIADVGQGSREEINFQPAASTGGENYGWNVMEGSQCFNAGSCNQSGLTLPVHDYDHSGGACSITGGLVYRGSAIPALAGTYFYADYCAGWVRSFRLSGGQASDHFDWADLAVNSPTSFGQDAAGELYIVGSGTVWRIVEASE